MIERIYEVSCDVCGDEDVVHAGTTLAEFFAASARPRWRRRGDKVICQRCWSSGRRWADATLYESPREPTEP